MANKVFSDENTRVLEDVIREIETDVTRHKLAKFMPSKDVPSNVIFTDVWEARGGLLAEHVMGADPQFSSRRQFRSQEFSPGSYREGHRFNEEDILRLRTLGQNDQTQRGIRQHLNESAIVLNNKAESRMELLRSQAIFNGQWSWNGRVIDFGIPGANKVSPVVPWIVFDGGGNAQANPASNPISDLRFWVLGGYAPYRKYKFKSMLWNKNTIRCFLDNPNVQSLIQSRFAAETYKQHDINAVIGFLIPGCPLVEEYDAWYQTETIDAVTGQITLSDAIYFVPDGQIFFEVELPDGNKIGDVVMTLNLSNGNIDSPAAGKFIIVDEHIADKPANPYIDLFCGFMGGPRLKRYKDVLTADVT